MTTEVKDEKINRKWFFPGGWQDISAALTLGAVIYSIFVTTSFMSMFSTRALNALTMTDYLAFAVSYSRPIIWAILFCIGALLLWRIFRQVFIGIPHFLGFLNHGVRSLAKRNDRSTANAQACATFDGGEPERPSVELRRGEGYPGTQSIWQLITTLLLGIAPIILWRITPDSLYASDSLSDLAFSCILFYAFFYYLSAFIYVISGVALYLNGKLVRHFNELRSAGYSDSEIEDIQQARNDYLSLLQKRRRDFLQLALIITFAVFGSGYGKVLALDLYGDVYRNALNPNDLFFSAPKDGLDRDIGQLSDSRAIAENTIPHNASENFEGSTLAQSHASAPRTHAERIEQNDETPLERDEVRYRDFEVVRVIEHGILAIDADRKNLQFVNDHGFIRASYRLERPEPAGLTGIGKLKTCVGAHSVPIQVTRWVSKGGPIEFLEGVVRIFVGASIAADDSLFVVPSPSKCKTLSQTYTQMEYRRTGDVFDEMMATKSADRDN